MASAFTLTDLSLHYSEKHLLEHVTLTVSEGDKIGIVGRNGAGKSTLLRLLAGTEEPDRGEVSRKRGLTVAYLPQTPDLSPEATITQAALDYLPAATPQEREAAAVKQALAHDEAVAIAVFGSGEEAHHQGAHRAAHAVDANGADGIINF